MTMNLPRLALWGLLGLVAGCNVLPEPQADAVRYFTLGKPVTAAPVAEGTVVSPVRLAAYLQPRQMAVRVAEHEVIYLDEVNWAEPLDDAISGVLRNRLGAVRGGATVRVTIQRCELVRGKGNTVELAATYTITPAYGDRRQVRHGAFVAPVRVWNGKDYAGLVGLIGRALDELGDALAVAVAEDK